MAFYFALGRRGMGKTTLTYKMAIKILRRLIFDPRGMIRGHLDAVVVTTRAEFQRAVREMIEGERLDGVSITEIVFTPAGDLDLAFDTFSAELRRWIMVAPTLPVAVIIDEASFINQRSRHFQWVVRCSPVDTFHTFMTCHRPLDLDTTVRAIADHWLIFQCRQEHDLKVIRERCSFEVAEQVTKLAPRHFVHWDDGKAAIAINRHGGTGGPLDWYIPLRASIPDRPEDERDRVSVVEPGEGVPGVGKLPLLAQENEDEPE